MREGAAAACLGGAVVTEIPYQVPKGKLIEQIAQLIADRKLPILADVRDESDAADPHRARAAAAATSIPELLMESLFRLTDLETRFAAQPQRARRHAHAEGDGAEARCSTDWLAAPDRGAGQRRAGTGWRRSPTGSSCSKAT